MRDSLHLPCAPRLHDRRMPLRPRYPQNPRRPKTYQRRRDRSLPPELQLDMVGSSLISSYDSQVKATVKTRTKANHDRPETMHAMPTPTSRAVPEASITVERVC